MKNLIQHLEAMARTHGATLHHPSTLRPLSIERNAKQGDFSRGVLATISEIYTLASETSDGRQAMRDLGFQPFPKNEQEGRLTSFSDPIYATDDYPREGCRLVIDVLKDGYALGVFSPCGKKMEGYATVKTPRAIARMVEEWCSGYAPRLHSRLDQSADKS